MCAVCNQLGIDLHKGAGMTLDGSATLGSLGSTTSGLPYRLDDQVGTKNSYDKTVFSLDQIIEQIDGGREISAANGVITYSFLTTPTTVGIYNNPVYGFPEPAGYTPLSAEQKAVARIGMALWDDLIPQKIVEKNGLGADIVMANTTTGPAQAWAYSPGQGYKIYSDVWTASPSANWTNQWLNPTGYGWTTMVHEQGHALGLSHPGAYNFGPGFAVNYQNGAEYAQDTRQYSIMSYWQGTFTGASAIDVAVGLSNYPQTPMLHDIVTIQAKYGADPTTRVGDTIYGFGSNAGRDIYDFSKNKAPYLSIYDAGGNDTIDFSGANSGVFIDLRPGSFSSGAVRPTLAEANAATAQFNAATDATQGDFALWTETSLNNYLTAVANNRDAQIAAVTGVTGVKALSHYNISIAYNTIIENATGGSMRDYLVGNQVANTLKGNGGDDVLRGLGGDDILWGGAGNDTFVYGPNEGGIDTIKDFTTGADKIDLHELVGVDAADVLFDATQDKLFVNTDADADYELTIIIQGSDLNVGTDLIFGS